MQAISGQFWPLATPTTKLQWAWLMAVQKKCGCTGTRSCLLCELARPGKEKWAPDPLVAPSVVFTQCSRCGELIKAGPPGEEDQAKSHVTCAPQGILKPSLSLPDGPRFDGVSVVKEFISREQEMAFIEFIDRHQWVESQSGRRKQVGMVSFPSYNSFLEISL